MSRSRSPRVAKEPAAEAAKVLRPKGGRPPNSPNKVTTEAKEALLSAFESMGGIAGLVKWGKKNPTEFYRIWARLLPKDANVSVTAVGVEELLRQLDEADAQGATLAEAAQQLGYTVASDTPDPKMVN